jgi:hypothetical protein
VAAPDNDLRLTEWRLSWSHCTVIVIVIGGLKSRGLTKTPIVCTEKISPVETPTIPGLSMLRDTSNSSIAYSSYR